MAGSLRVQSQPALRISSMKLTAIFLLPNFGFSTNVTSTRGLRDIVEKYKDLSMGNTEFSQWIKKLDIVSKWSPMEEKLKFQAQFRIYNERRLELENSITNRINTIDILINKLPIEEKRCL
ncbi:uncharacterized protein LOC108033281 [Drosophila biarmipes]|uniref:uncharacterized protein LOC108033281 n=1 Tax=Drosophila biarmipes TaxID=125945 RepID=UPI0021CC781A|nr:uncharacterized protein LOC108033281 [Drosophila biarmipes]